MQSKAEILSYRHPAVIRRFARERKVSFDRATAVFGDLMRYFWYAMTDQPELRPSKTVDAMWHAFLLYNRDYNAWTERAFGTIIYHVPEPMKPPRTRRHQFERA